MLGIGLFRSLSTAWMPSFDQEKHLDEKRLLSFYRLWTANPELVSDSEFDEIQIHLLECEDCAAKARICEEKSRALPLLLLPGKVS